jgi:hypothetical protein
MLAVSTVLDRAGALCEAIKNDYGEDLLAQTQLSGVADPFHILIQVKGTSLKRKNKATTLFELLPLIFDDGSATLSLSSCVYSMIIMEQSMRSHRMSIFRFGH